MKFRRYLSPSFVLSLVALFVALGGGAAVAATQFVNNAGHLGGTSPSYYLAAKHFVSSGGEKFLSVGQTKVLGHAGHYTFSATCTNPTGQQGAQQVTFDVTATPRPTWTPTAVRSRPEPRSTSTPTATRWTRRRTRR